MRGPDCGGLWPRPPSLFLSLLSQPPLLRLPGRREGGRSLRQGRAEGATVARSLRVYGFTCLRRAHLRRRGFVLGSRFPGCQGRASGSPASPAGCPRTPEGRFRPVWRAEAAEEPRLRLRSHFGMRSPARLGSAGLDPRWGGRRSEAPGCRDALGASASAGRWRPGHPTPPPPGTVGAASPHRAVEFPPENA